MTADIAQQTQIQGGKLGTIDEEMAQAADKVNMANDQLEQKLET